MNKRQLASKIWNAANKMRSKIEANEYKDYILGFIFYKYLSEKEEEYLIDADYPREEWHELVVENDAETVEDLKNNLGYFIPYTYLFSTWLTNGVDVATVRDALSSFTRHISSTRKDLFRGIFDVLHTGLSHLGENALAQSKAIRALLALIESIPMSGQRDYDVLGFIYEYLISQFAANAGKKAGEFYTPHEVSLLMSEIVAHHLQDRKSISIYDPTSGSGSLLINIGRSMSRYIPANRISYYAQELKANTFNLTRMNLVMRGIIPANITTRNADTLEDDWPRQSDDNPLWVDAVVSNPPYSQNWSSAGKENDPRYREFGLAPKSKADYAFLLHDLHHLKSDGIMCIVLPHGVLFRGGEEAEIRRKLIDKGHIHAIIGLPANIFFGTGIPTIIMVLRQHRQENDVLIVDASRGFVKEGKDNKLRACDIRKIVDIVTSRSEIPKFSRLVSLEEIRANEYNLNIPRYVDSSDPAESWDLFASMFGGIPAAEIDSLSEYWAAFPHLKESIFHFEENGYYSIVDNDITALIRQHDSVRAFENDFESAFVSFPNLMQQYVIDEMQSLNIAETEAKLRASIFQFAELFPIVNKYEVFQTFHDSWTGIAADLEMIATEGFDVATRQVDEYTVIKKKEGKEVEVKDGWVGHILPFALVEKIFLSDDVAEVSRLEAEVLAAENEITDIIETFDAEEQQQLLNNGNDAFDKTKLNAAVKLVLEADEATSPLIATLEAYSACSKKQKPQFVAQHPEVEWSRMKPGANGLYTKKTISLYIEQLKYEILADIPIVRAKLLVDKLPNLKSQLKDLKSALHLKTKNTIESLSDVQALSLLKEKWITPVLKSIKNIPSSVINALCSKVKRLNDKYAVTFTDIESDIASSERLLSSLLDELSGPQSDLLGIQELKKMLSPR